MPAIINSDDGVVSGSSGLKTSGANDGITVFQQNGTEAMRIDSSGNITVKDKIQFGIDAQTNIQAGGTSDVDLIVAADTNIRFETATNERMRLDSSGNLLVATTTSNGLITSIQASTSAYSGYFTSNYTANNNASINFWGRSGGAVAAAVRYKDTGTSMEFYSPTGHTVAYTTSSDYRLKENIQPMIGALAKVAALKPVTYSWKAGFGTGGSQGFIAHELAEVVPQCVTGEKDAVDAEGNPQYQGIDTSFLVATLTAAIQELKAELDATKAEVAALKARTT